MSDKKNSFDRWYESGGWSAPSVKSGKEGGGEDPCLADFKSESELSSGSAHFSALSAKFVKVLGSTSAQAVTARELRASGSFRVASDASACVAHLSGAISIGNSAYFKSIEASGSCSIGKALRAKSARFSGLLTCPSITCDELIVEGRIEAKEITSPSVSLKGTGTIEKLNGDVISISGENQHWTALLMEVIGKKEGGLIVVDAIKATDRVTLERCDAELVEAPSVNVGKGCRVKRVVYTRNLIVHKTSVVESVQGPEGAR
ncbi:MAG: hypothetical protein ACP5T2_00055 [Thermoprotei archaeon]